jgi:hypothetical protein
MNQQGGDWLTLNHPESICENGQQKTRANGFHINENIINRIQKNGEIIATTEGLTQRVGMLLMRLEKSIGALGFVFIAGAKRCLPLTTSSHYLAAAHTRLLISSGHVAIAIKQNTPARLISLFNPVNYYWFFNTAVSVGWRVFLCEPRDLCNDVMAGYIKEIITEGK